MGVDETVWASVRRAHEDTTESAAKFCKRFGVSVSTYYKRRKREGWPSRQGDGRKPGADQDNGGSSSRREGAKQTRASSPTRLIKRLYAAIDQELQHLEADACECPAAGVADIERRTRTLMNMIRGFEKVLELDADKQKPEGSRAKRGAGQGAKRQDTRVSVDDAERMRQDIAERLERLNAQWADTSGSGSAGS